MSKTFETRYRVMYHDSDLSGCLSVPGLGNYILDTAGVHATELDISMQKLAAQDMTWVMAGMRMEILDLPPINSIIDISTWIAGCSKISSKRDFRVTCNGRPVANVSTEWLIINTKTRRPIFLTEVFPQVAELVSEGDGIEKYQHLRFSIDETKMAKGHKIISYSDIDINTHLYSMRYLEMSLDVLGLDFIRQRRIKVWNVNFVSEVLYGKEVDILVEENGDIFDIEMRESGKTMYKSRIETEKI